eukprot:365974-Chlamydomonas_euryale.AAC.3
MHDRLNKTRIVHAAMFDLLTSQCDRHAQRPAGAASATGRRRCEEARGIWGDDVRPADQAERPTGAGAWEQSQRKGEKGGTKGRGALQWNPTRMTVLVPADAAQNIFIAEDGGIMLIDNERAFYENKWCACVVQPCSPVNNVPGGVCRAGSWVRECGSSRAGWAEWGGAGWRRG